MNAAQTGYSRIETDQVNMAIAYWLQCYECGETSEDYRYDGDRLRTKRWFASQAYHQDWRMNEKTHECICPECISNS